MVQGFSSFHLSAHQPGEAKGSGTGEQGVLEGNHLRAGQASMWHSSLPGLAFPASAKQKPHVAQQHTPCLAKREVRLRSCVSKPEGVIHRGSISVLIMAAFCDLKIVHANWQMTSPYDYVRGKPETLQRTHPGRYLVCADNVCESPPAHSCPLYCSWELPPALQLDSSE